MAQGAEHLFSKQARSSNPRFFASLKDEKQSVSSVSFDPLGLRSCDLLTHVLIPI
jgi:hypothetical protein